MFATSSYKLLLKFVELSAVAVVPAVVVVEAIGDVGVEQMVVVILLEAVVVLLVTVVVGDMDVIVAEVLMGALPPMLFPLSPIVVGELVTVAAAALTATLHGGAVTLVLYTLHYSNLQCSIALC